MRRSPQGPAAGVGRRIASDQGRLLAQGKIDAVGEVTLTAGAATTTVDDDGAVYCSSESGVFLTPTTANAAAAIASGALYVVADMNAFTIYHPNNGQTDRTFRYAVLG